MLYICMYYILPLTKHNFRKKDLDYDDGFIWLFSNTSTVVSVSYCCCWTEQTVWFLNYGANVYFWIVIILRLNTVVRLRGQLRNISYSCCSPNHLRYKVTIFVQCIYCTHRPKKWEWRKNLSFTTSCNTGLPWQMGTKWSKMPLFKFSVLLNINKLEKAWILTGYFIFFYLRKKNELKVSFWDCHYESNKMDKAKERENVAQKQDVLFLLIILKECKRQLSRNRREVSGDQISKNANLSDWVKQVKNRRNRRS